MAILITGSAGFIGYHTVKALIDKGEMVYGVDNLSNNPQLARRRLDELHKLKNYTHINCDIKDTQYIEYQVGKAEIKTCIHLAAKAGVQESLTNPKPYIDTNMLGFDAIFTYCTKHRIKLVYASSASVYGNSYGADKALHEGLKPLPVNLYGLSKYYNELVASKTDIETIGLRFFNVYGTHGRPDSLLYKLLNSTADKPVTLHNDGNLYRDWTHVDDIVDGIIAAVTLNSENLEEVVNLGRGKPVSVSHMVEMLRGMGVPVWALRSPQAPEEEMKVCWADTNKAHMLLGCIPRVDFEIGLRKVVNWFTTAKHQAKKKDQSWGWC
jgi:UDP-glucuronate 4-epimerase